MEFLFGNANFIDNIVNSIIRPPRAYNYSECDLGPEYQNIRGITVQRVDLNVLNQKNQMLKSTIFLPRNNYQNIKKCCIYLHGNAGSRTEGSIYLHHFIMNNIALFTMDFSGSGKSDGDIVTLGLAEQDDLHSAIKFLDEIFRFQEYSIWGRSMGAVTALLYQSNANLHPQQSSKITSLILDSPFESFKQLCIDIGKQQFSIPSFVINMFIELVQKKILSKTNYDILSIDLKKPVQDIETPALYIYSQSDSLINYKHSLTLIENHGINKQKRNVEQHIFNGDHNDIRDDKCIQAAIQFLQKQNQINNLKQISALKEVNNIDRSGSSQVKAYQNCSNVINRPEALQRYNQNVQLTESFRQIPNKEERQKQILSTVRNKSVQSMMQQNKQSLKLNIVNCNQIFCQATAPLTLENEPLNSRNLIREQSPSTRINMMKNTVFNILSKSQARTQMRPSSIYHSIKPSSELLSRNRTSQTINNEFFSPTNNRIPHGKIF